MTECMTYLHINRSPSLWRVLMYLFPMSVLRFVTIELPYFQSISMVFGRNVYGFRFELYHH